MESSSRRGARLNARLFTRSQTGMASGCCLRRRKRRLPCDEGATRARVASRRSQVRGRRILARPSSLSPPSLRSHSALYAQRYESEISRFRSPSRLPARHSVLVASPALLCPGVPRARPGQRRSEPLALTQHGQPRGVCLTCSRTEAHLGASATSSHAVSHEFEQPKVTRLSVRHRRSHGLEGLWPLCFTVRSGYRNFVTYCSLWCPIESHGPQNGDCAPRLVSATFARRFGWSPVT